MIRSSFIFNLSGQTNCFYRFMTIYVYVNLVLNKYTKFFHEMCHPLDDLKVCSDSLSNYYMEVSSKYLAPNTLLILFTSLIWIRI